MTTEEFKIHAESGRSNKGRHCKKFYSGEGCPYGESCTFLHDESSRNREGFAISLGPRASDVAQIVKPSNWKTRICNKWEITGFCPFGTNCHFMELQSCIDLVGDSLKKKVRSDHLLLPIQ